jgi:hypothetical protein
MEESQSGGVEHVWLEPQAGKEDGVTSSLCAHYFGDLLGELRVLRSAVGCARRHCGVYGEAAPIMSIAGRREHVEVRLTEGIS